MTHVTLLFKSWSSLAYHNSDIFRIIRPIISRSLNDPNIKNNTTTLLYNMVTAGIRDPELFEKMIASIE
jgi:hypothetical protein